MRRLLLPAIILATAVAAAAEPDEKASRFHTLLLAKPENPALVARFLDAWLESSDQAALTDFLRAKAEAGTAQDWRVLAAVQEFTGNDEAAVTALDKAVKLAPDALAAHLARGRILAKLLRIDPALADLNAAAADPQLHLEATTLAGRLLAQAGKPDEALKAWDSLLEKHPDDPGLREDLIELLLQENLTTQAVESARKLVELTKDPYQKALRRLRVAEILALANKPAEAASEYQAVLALSAQDSWLEKETLALAEKLFNSARNTNGYRKFLEEAIAAAPTRTALHLALAAHHLASGDTAKAIAIHRELLRSVPDSVPIRQSLAGILQQSDQPREAVAEIRLLTAQNPADPALWQQLATLCQTLNDSPGLNKAIAKSIALLPNDTAGKIQAAQLHERFQQTDQARTILEAAAKQDGPHSEAADSLAQFLARNKEPEKAVALWTEAAKSAPRDELLRISRSLSAHGKTLEAYQVLAARAGDFAADQLVLSALCQAALLTDEAAPTIPRALALLDLASTPTDTQTAVQLALSLIRRAQAEDATIRDLTNSPAPSVQRLCLLAHIHESLGDSLSAAKTLTAATANDPSHCALLQQIALHETRGDLTAAIATLRQLIALPGNRTPAYLRQLVGLQRRAGLPEDAATTAREWKTIAPGDKAAFLTLADLHSDLGKLTESTAEIRRAIAKFGNDPELREKLATTLIAAGSHAEAFRIILQLHDEAESPAAKLKLAPSLAQAATACGREQELEETFRKRIRENPSATSPILVLRELLSTWNRPNETTALLEQAARTSPNDIPLQIQLADNLETIGDRDQAETILSGLARSNPTPDTLRRLATFHSRNGDTEKADAIIHRLALESNDPRQLETLVLTPYQAAQWESVLTIINAARPDVAADWRIAYLKASALEQLDRPDEALPVFLSLLKETRELKLPPPATGPTPYGGYPRNRYGNYPPQPPPRQPVSPEAQTMADLNRGISTAYPVDNYGSSSRFFTPKMLLQNGRGTLPANLPSTSRDLRLCSLVHCFAIACRKPPAERAACLDRITLPEIHILADLKRIAAMKEDESLDSLVAANPTDAALIRLSSSVRLSSLIEPVHPGKPVDRNRQPENGGRFVLKPETWLAAAKALAATDSGAALDCITNVRLGSEGPQKALVPVFYQTILEICRNAPAEAIADRAFWLLNLSNNSTADPDKIKFATELETLVTSKLPADDPALDRQKLVSRYRELNASVVEGRYSEAATAINQLVAKWKADTAKGLPTSTGLRSMYPNNRYNRSFGNNYGQDEGLVPVDRQIIARQMNYQYLIETAHTAGCTLLSGFDRSSSRLSDPPPAIPPEISALLKEIAKLSDSTSPVTKERPPKWVVSDKPAFLAAAATIEDPLLRLIILDALDFQPELRTAIAELTKPEASPTPAVLLWSSAWLSSRGSGDMPAAYTLAVRATAAPDPQWSSIALTQLAATGIRLDEKAKASLDLDPARSAVLRMSRSLYNPEQRADFAGHLRKLGMPEMATALSKKPSSSLTARYRGQQSFRQPSKDPASLVRNGNRAAAARLLYRALASTNDEYATRQSLANITQLKLEKDIAALQPPPSASFEKRAEYLGILCKITPPATHREKIERLHRERPDHPETLTLLCQASDPAKQPEIFKTLASSPESDLHLIGTSMLGKRSHSSSKPDDYIANLTKWKPVIALLDAIPAELSASKNLTWINNSIPGLAGSTYIDGCDTSIPALGSRPQTIPESANEETKAKFGEIQKLTTLRRDTLRDLATAMLKHPGTAEQAFQILYAGRSEFGLDDGMLAKLAMDALSLTFARSLEPDPLTSRSGIPRYQLLWANISSSGGSSYGSTLRGGISPETFLARHPAVRPEENPSSVLVGKLPAESGKILTSYLETLKKPTLGEITKIVAPFLDEKDTAARPDYLTKAFWLADLDGADSTAATTMFFEKIGTEPLLKSRSGNQDPFTGVYQPSSLPVVARYIAARWLSSAPAAERWTRIEKLATDLLGPQKLWPAYGLVGTLSQGGYYDEGLQDAQNRMGALRGILLGNGEERREIPNLLAVRFLANQGLTFQESSEDRSLPDRFPDAFNEVKPKNADSLADSITDYLLATGLFAPGPGMFAQDGAFLPLDIIGSPPEAIRSALANSLAKTTGPDRFWASLTASALAKAKAQTVAQLVLTELQSVRRWPRQQQAGFAEFLSGTWPALESSKLSTWLASADEGMEDDLESRLTKAITSDAASGGSRQTAVSLSYRLMRRSPDRAAACWGRALAAADPNRSNVSECYRSLIQSLSYSSDRARVPVADVLRFVIATPTTPTNRASGNDRLESLINRIVSPNSDSDNLPVPDKWAAAGKGDSSQLVGLFAIIRDRDLTGSSILLPALLTNYWQYRLAPDSAKRLGPWVDKEIAPRDPLCAQLIRCIVANVIASRINSKPNAAARADANHALLSHPKFPPGARLATLATLRASNSSNWSDPRIAAHVIAWAENPELTTPQQIQLAKTLLGELPPAFFSPEQAGILASKTIPAVLAADEDLPVHNRITDLRSSMLGNWLALAARSGDKASTAGVVTANKAEFAGNFNHLTRLALEGLPELAATLVPPLHEPFMLDSCYLYGGGSSGKVVFRFDRKIEAALPPLLDAIKDPQQRYRVECLMHIYHDTREDTEKPAVSRDDRIDKLTARFKTDAPAQQQARMEILCAIAPGKDGSLADVHKSLCANLHMGDLIDDRYRLRSPNDAAERQRIDYRISALDRLISINLNKGNPTEFIKQCSGVSTITGDAGYFAGDRLRIMLVFFAPRCLSAILHAAPEEKEKLLDSARTLAIECLADSDSGYRNQIKPHLRLFLMFAHAAAGKGSELVPWWDKQPAPIKSRLKFVPGSNNDGPTYHEQDYAFWKDMTFAIDGHKESGTELLTALLTDKDLAAIEISPRYRISDMETSGMFTFDTIKAAIQAVPDTFPRKPEYLTELAGIFAWRKNDGKSALATWQSAEEIDARHHGSAYSDRPRASRFIYFVDCKRDADAAALLPAINRDKLDKRTLGTFDARAATLKERTKGAPAKDRD